MRTVLLAACLVCAGVSASAAPSVLFVSEQFGYLEDYDALGDVRAAGFEAGAMTWSAVTPDTLQPFNVVVITDVPIADEQGRVAAPVQAAFEAIWEYNRSGGGVLACMGIGKWDKGRVAANVLLAPWDAGLLDEQVTDPVDIYLQSAGIRWQYSWTRNVAPSPITAGIETIFYPSRPWRADSQKTLFASRFGPDWKILVRGGPTARSVRGVPGSSEMATTPATYDSAPPIAGSRAVGQGRVVLMPLWPNWTFWGARHPSMESIVWEAGAAGVRSDTGRFLIQALAWLAEPSLESGSLGGYSTPESPPARPDRYPPRPVDWSDPPFPQRRPWRHMRVLAGARSAYTVGQGTVTEYRAAARAAGYDAVLFAEPLARLTPESWVRLRRDCTAATTDDFLALPGIEFESVQGDRYVAFGEFDYPAPPGLAADGRRVDDTYHLWGSQMHSGFLAIQRLQENPSRDPQMLKNMTACAVATYENGRLVDDSMEPYLALDAQFHNLVPIALHFVTAPAEVVAAATTGLQSVWLAGDAAELKEQITPRRQAGVLYWANPHRTYLSEGPRLQEWAGANTVYWGPAAAGSDRWRIRFDVASDAGMQQVEILDRGRPYLRYAGEAESIAGDFPGYHDNQHVFHLLARDDAGRRLLSSGVRTRFSDTYVNQSGDHQNIIAATLQRNGAGRWIYTSGTTANVFAGWRPSWGAPCPVDMTERYPPMWDGGASGSSGSAAVEVVLEGGEREGGESSASSNLFELAGPEVQILDQIVRHKYPDDTPPRRDSAPTYRTIPTKYLDYTVRRITPTARFERAGLSINEITITAKRDFTLDPSNPMALPAYQVSDYGSRLAGQGDHVFITFADGRALNRIGRRDDGQTVVDGEMAPGNYVAAYPHPYGAVGLYPLTPVRARMTLTRTLFVTTFAVPETDPAVPAGKQWRVRFLAVSASTDLGQGNQVHDDIRRSLGIGGPPAYRCATGKGRVLDTTARLLAEAEDAAFAAGFSRTAMPTDLLLEVRGLTEGWTAMKQVGDLAPRPITCVDDTGYTNLDLDQGEVRVVLGHPATCSDRRVRLVSWLTDTGLEVYANNPTTEPVKAKVTPNAAFRWVADLAARPRKISLPPGGSVTLRWKR